MKRVTENYHTMLPEKGRYEHPVGRDIERGNLKPCTFTLSKNFKRDRLKRWERMADVEVSTCSLSIPKKLKTYLIPSNAVPPFLSHATSLKTDIKYLSLKSRITEIFVRENIGHELHGVMFYLKHGGMEYPHIYCHEYDKFLCENFSNYQ